LSRTIRLSKRRAKTSSCSVINRLDFFAARGNIVELKAAVVGARQALRAAHLSRLIHVEFCLSLADDSKPDCNESIARRDLRQLWQSEQ
jgi:hypothetical protein